MATTTVETGTTFVTYTGDGVETDFTFAFTSIHPSEIKVQVNGSNQVYTTGVAALGQYSVSGATVTLGSAGADGDVIKIFRNTKRDARYVDFAPGATLTAATLDKDSDQLFNLVQELIDGQLTATGFLPAPGGGGTNPEVVVPIDGDDGTGGIDTGTNLDNALLQVFRNGILMHPSDYSISGTTITTAYPLEVGDIILIQLLTGGGSITTISNGAVNTSQIAEDAITNDKIADGAVDWSKLKDADFDGAWGSIEATESPQGLLENLNTRLAAAEATITTLSAASGGTFAGVDINTITG